MITALLFILGWLVIGCVVAFLFGRVTDLNAIPE